MIECFTVVQYFGARQAQVELNKLYVVSKIMGFYVRFSPFQPNKKMNHSCYHYHEDEPLLKSYSEN